jgi:hypothetical protein
MNKVSELKVMIGQTFSWNKARLDCFVRMLLALFAVRTVNLSEIAVAFASEAEISSRYKRLQRFFAQFRFDYSQVACWIFKLFFSENKSLYLTIDRTNWYWGKSKINIFVLGIAYEGLSIPLFWQALPKAGNSNFNERCFLINRFLSAFPQINIAGLLADREFASGEFFRWLTTQKIPFYIRIKEGSMLRIRKNKWVTAKKLFSSLHPKYLAYPMTLWIFKQKLYLAASRSEKGELMLVATNANPKKAIASYLRRWEIECLFQSLKGRGFRFEETHMTSLERIEKLMVLLAIGFCWAHKIGEWRATLKPITFKKHPNNFRLQNNFFRYGFDFIRDLILNPYKKIYHFKRCLLPFSPLIRQPLDNLF